MKRKGKERGGREGVEEKEVIKGREWMGREGKGRGGERRKHTGVQAYYLYRKKPTSLAS